MTTGEMITMAIGTQASGYPRPTVLATLRLVQDVLIKQECAQLQFTDINTGKPPTLADAIQITPLSFLIDLTATYEDLVLWRVARLMTIVRQNDDYGHLNDYDQMNVPPRNTTEYVEVNGNYYNPYYNGRTFDADSAAVSPTVGVSEHPIVILSRTPEIALDEIYLQCYFKAIPLTTEKVQLTIPDSNGIHFMYILPALVKALQMQADGDVDGLLGYLTAVRPKVWAALSGGAQGKRHSTQSRAY